MYAKPICTTLFALEDKVTLSDPNKQEEEFMRSFVVLCTLDEERVCMMKKLGGASLVSEQMSFCIDRALKNGSHLRKTLNNLFNNYSAD